MAELTTEQLKDRVREILLTGGNIKETGTTTLRNGSAADAPFAMVEVGSAQYAYDAGNDTSERVRDLSITIFVQPVELGAEMEAEDACDPYFDLIPTLFERRPTLTKYDSDLLVDNASLPSVKNAYLVSDGGYDTLRFGNVSWACAAGFVLRVEMKFERIQNY